MAPPFEQDSDDTISVTSTVESQQHEEYPVEEIIAEGLQEGDTTKWYLVKWEGYPLYRCTWEPDDNFVDAKSISDWQKKKRFVDQQQKIAEYYEAVEDFQDQKSQRKKRRKAKRKKQGLPVSSTATSSSSSDHGDSGTKPTTRKPDEAASPVKGAPSRRGKALAPTGGADEESEADVPLMLQKKKPAKTSGAVGIKKKDVASVIKKNNYLPDSSSDESSDRDSRFGEPKVKNKAAATSAPAKPSTSEPRKPSLTAPTSDTSNKISQHKPTVPPKKAPAPSASAPKAKRSQTQTNVFANWTAAPNRRKRQSNAGLDSTADKSFRNLATQNAFRKISGSERAPNPDALATVDPKTGKTTAPAKITSNPYQRRSPPPPEIRQRSPSPAAPRFRAPTGPNKTCWYWARGYCRYSEDVCRFAHRHMPQVADPPPPALPVRVPQDTSLPDLQVQPDLPMPSAPKALTPAPQLPPPIVSACEKILGISEKLLFTGGLTGRTINKVACLVIPPRHDEEIKLLTKYLKAVQCKVFYASIAGQWDHFWKKYWKGGGVIIFHPDFWRFHEMPGFGKVLMQQDFNMFTVGRDSSYWYDQAVTYGCRRLFPIGGVIFITDDVFVYHPDKAMAVLYQYMKDNADMPRGGEQWKIQARPVVKDWLLHLGAKKFDEQEGKDQKDKDMRWTYLWLAMGKLFPHADEDMADMVLDKYKPPRTDGREKYPNPLPIARLISNDPDEHPNYSALWETDEVAATEYMVEQFVHDTIMASRKYERRRAVVIHQPSPARAADVQGRVGVTNKMDPQGWEKKWPILDVATPGKWLDQQKRKVRKK